VAARPLAQARARSARRRFRTLATWRRTTPPGISSTAATWRRNGQSYAPDTQAICTAFVAGINAYVALCESEPKPACRRNSRSSAPGRRTGSRADVVRIRSHALTRNGISEILRANIMALAMPPADLLRFELDPPSRRSRPRGSRWPISHSRHYSSVQACHGSRHLRQGSSRDRNAGRRLEMDRGHRSRRYRSARSRRRGPTTGPSMARAPRPAGRSWPATRTGRMPCHRCVISCTSTAPGFNVIGTGEPTAPGISLGHNDTHRLRPDHLRRRPGRRLCLRNQGKRSGQLIVISDGWEKDHPHRGEFRRQGSSRPDADARRSPATARSCMRTPRSGR
jgi:hypothetical protein